MRIPFVQLDLERTGVGEHVVVCTHTSQDRIHWTQAIVRGQREHSAIQQSGYIPCAFGGYEHAKLGHDLGGQLELNIRAASIKQRTIPVAVIRIA